MKKLAFVISTAVAVLLCLSVQNGFSQNAGETKCDGEDLVIQKTNSKGDTSKTTLRVPEFTKFSKLKTSVSANPP